MRPTRTAITLGGEEVFLSQWMLGDSEKVIEAQKKYADEEIQCEDFFAVVAICSLCDADGNRIFEDADLAEVTKSSAVSLKAIYRAAMELNTIKVDDPEESEKN